MKREACGGYVVVVEPKASEVDRAGGEGGEREDERKTAHAQTTKIACDVCMYVRTCVGGEFSSELSGCRAG